MWPLFFLACLLMVAILYLPGAFAFCALGLRLEDAVACAPIYGVALISLNAVILPHIGLSASLLTLVVPALAFGVIAYAVAAVRRRKALRSVRSPSRSMSFPERDRRRILPSEPISSMTVTGIFWTPRK